MSEKIVDSLMLQYYKNIFGYYYHTENNKLLFKQYIPDGWDIVMSKYNKPILIIIENKKNKSLAKQGYKQLLNYYDILPDNIKNDYIIYLILGYKDDNDMLKYMIFNKNKEQLKLKLKDIMNNVVEYKRIDKGYIHKINQYIYDNIKLDKQHKTLFIASILLCLKINPCLIYDFKEINKNTYFITNNILRLIDNYYNDKVFSDSFKFIKKMINVNDEILTNIFNTISLIIKNNSVDILNLFYSEFCIWDKNDDKNNGIVLTPHDIITLMVNELNISENDKVLDFCTGTGSFLIDASKHTNNIYGCECSIERYTLAKTNFILNNINYENLKFNSCFNEHYETNYFDKIIINPPFSLDCQDNENNNNKYNWKNFDKEQRFAMYAIELLKPNGIASIIIPRSNFAQSSKGNKQRDLFKKSILQYCDIIKVINLNTNVFYPVASVECTIIILKKLTKPRNITINDKFTITTIDMSDDGYEISKNKRVYKKEPKQIIKDKSITYLDDWNYEKDIGLLSLDELNYLIKTYNINYNYSISLNNVNINKSTNTQVVSNNEQVINDKQEQVISNDKKDNYLSLMNKENIKQIVSIKEWKTLKLSSILERVKPLKRFQIKTSEPGNIPLITRCSTNNGITKYINDYSFDGTKEILLTIAPSGSTGYCYYHNYKFAVDGIIITLKLLDKSINPHLLSLLITNKFTQIYSYTNGLTIDKILNETINYPIIDNTQVVSSNKQTTNDKKDNYLSLMNKENIKQITSIKEWKTLKLSSILERIKPIKIFKISESDKGKYPLISSKSTNNGITDYINDYSYYSNELYLSINRNGSVGYCFVQTGYIAITTDIILYNIVDNSINPYLLSLLITNKFTQIYNYNNKLTIDKILNETINYPVINDQ